VLLTIAGAGGVTAQDQTVDPPHPVHIHAGACPEPGDVVAPLSDLVVGSDDAVGSAAAVPAEYSTSTVPLSLADIVAADHAINAHESKDAMDHYIACGDIGGAKIGDVDLVITLAEQNGSGHIGAALLHDNGDGTTRVDVYLVRTGEAGPGASPMASEVPMASPMASETPMASPMASEMPMASPSGSMEPVASPAAS
jgi:hypothetical protein